MVREQSPPAEPSLAEVLQAFSFAADMAFGLPFEDGMRACYLAMRVAETLALPVETRATVYYAALLKDTGCTCQTTQLADAWKTDEIAARRDYFTAETRGLRGIAGWLRTYPAAGQAPHVRLKTIAAVVATSKPLVEEALTAATVVCARMCERLGLPAAVAEAARNFFEQWDGKGVPGERRGADIPIAARVLLPAFTVPTLLPTFSRSEIAQFIRSERAKWFDPDVADACQELLAGEAFWEELRGPEITARVLAMAPRAPGYEARPGLMDDVALAFADFIDLKSPHMAAHSRRVARIAEGLAKAAGCGPADRALVRRAALMHDLGLVAVPSFALNKPERQRTAAEREQLRLHPYYGERILEWVPALAPVQPIVGAHHEHVDGSGYFRGLRGNAIPLPARICAVADRLDDLVHDSPGEPALPLPRALEVLQSEAGTGLDADLVAAAGEALGYGGEPSRPTARPAGLTEREVEVLRLAAAGLTRREAAARLGISENTVRHHLEHIYNKTGTSTRVGATLFAIEHGLVV